MNFFSRCKCPILHPLGIPSLEMRLLLAEDPQTIQVQATRIHQVSITDMILQFMNTHVPTLTYLWLVRSNVVTCPIFVCSIYKSQSILEFRYVVKFVLKFECPTWNSNIERSLVIIHVNCWWKFPLEYREPYIFASPK